MSELFDTAYTCGDGEALVAYVYGESTPSERQAIAAHLVRCAACAEEIEALGATRQQLVAWTPPEQTLGFQLTPADAAVRVAEDAPAPATVLRPAAWWRQPLPAWAQMAAAVAIFASGLAMGAARGATSAAPAVAPETTAAATPARTAGAPAAVTRGDLARVEEQLRGEIAQLRRASAPAAPAGDAVLQQVRQLIAASEARQRNELELRTSALAVDFSNARVIDHANFEKKLAVTNGRIFNNQQDINSVAQRVGYSPAYSPYVP